MAVTSLIPLFMSVALLSRTALDMTREVNNQRNQGGSRYTEGESGSRVGGTNAMEINKVLNHFDNLALILPFLQIAQCSKMVPGMSGSEIRASLEAVNWDTNIAVKNLKIDKLYRLAFFSQHL